MATRYVIQFFNRDAYTGTWVSKSTKKGTQTNALQNTHMYIDWGGCGQEWVFSWELSRSYPDTIQWIAQVFAPSSNITRYSRHLHPPVRAIAGTYALLQSSGFWKESNRWAAWKTYRECGKRHEADQVIPHFIDVLKQLLQLLTAHRSGFDPQLHTFGHPVHLHNTWHRGTEEKVRCGGVEKETTDKAALLLVDALVGKDSIWTRVNVLLPGTNHLSVLQYTQW